jgi:hypothetical protein
MGHTYEEIRPHSSRALTSPIPYLSSSPAMPFSKKALSAASHFLCEPFLPGRNTHSLYFLPESGWLLLRFAILKQYSC